MEILRRINGKANYIKTNNRYFYKTRELDLIDYSRRESNKIGVRIKGNKQKHYVDAKVFDFGVMACE